jgi:hypothetical protein
MPRMRTIKPGFFTNEDLVALPATARLFFQGLWCWGDREGRLEDRPGRLKLEILPADDVDADELLARLAERGFIVRYEVDGRRLIQVVNFRKHQNPHIKEPPSVLPPPGKHGASTVQTPGEHPTSPADHGYLGHGPWAMGHGRSQEATQEVTLTSGGPESAGPPSSTESLGVPERRTALHAALVDRFGPPANAAEVRRLKDAVALLDQAGVDPDEALHLAAVAEERWRDGVVNPLSVAKRVSDLRTLRSRPARKGSPTRGAADQRWEQHAEPDGIDAPSLEEIRARATAQEPPPYVAHGTPK